MENQKVRDLATAISPKATDFVMLITNLTNNVLEKCQISVLRDILTSNSISEDEGNALTTGSDDKFYVPDLSENIDIVENNVEALTGDVENVSNDLTVLTERVNNIDTHSTIIDTWQEQTEGYRIWSDGYCEQWGRYIIQTNGVGTITFIKTFANTNYDIYACKTSSDRSTWTIMFDTTDAWTPTSIAIKSNLTGYVLGGSWRAFGYLAEGEY